MPRVRTALTAPPDKWWGGLLNVLSPLPGPARRRVALLGASLSCTVKIDMVARAAAVSRDPRGPDRVARLATRGRVDAAGILHAAEGDSLARVAPRHLLSLAWLLFVQHRGPDSYLAACTVFDHVNSRVEAAVWDARFRRAYAEALLAAKRRDDALRVIHTMGTSIEREMLAIDAQREDGADPAASDLAALWQHRGHAAVELRQGSEPAFDRLTATAPPTHHHGPLVSVVMSSYRPDTRVVAAVRSVLRSSWQNLEVLVVDDASGDDYTDVYTHVAGLDPRVRVHTMPTNGGTYGIRNWALEHAHGELITFHDSDDWMHPERIAVQAAHLVANPDVVHNASRSARVTETLLFSHTRNLGAQICEPSLMMRREQARALAGSFDAVRKGADAEYRLRLERLTGRETVVCGRAPLTLQLVVADSLSNTDIVRHWFAPARRVYRSCFEQWHHSAADLRLEASAPRSFYAPTLVRGRDEDPTPDVVVVSNWLEQGTWNMDDPAAARIVSDLVVHGYRVAIAHEAALLPLARMRASLSASAARLLNEGAITYIDVERLRQAPVKVVVAPADSKASADRAMADHTIVYASGRAAKAATVTDQVAELLGPR